jgi:hypothetical protein
MKAPPKPQKPEGRRPDPTRPVHRRDATGHLDPKYAADLLQRSRESASHDDERAFVDKPKSRDPLAEVLAEEFLQAATTGEDPRADELNQGVPEDQGGPFIVTKARDEFALGRDKSNPRGATREPFPKALGDEREED